MKRFCALAGVLLAAAVLLGSGEVRVSEISDEEASLGRSCSRTEACSGGTFCFYNTGSCGEDGQSGVCEKKPDVCAMIYAPVCGCDGKTYSNLCTAKGKAVSLRHDGSCE